MKPDFDRKMISQIALTFLIVLLLSVPVQHLLHLSFFLSIFSIYYTFLGIKWRGGGWKAHSDYLIAFVQTHTLFAIIRQPFLCLFLWRPPSPKLPFIIVSIIVLSLSPVDRCLYLCVCGCNSRACNCLLLTVLLLLLLVQLNRSSYVHTSIGYWSLLRLLLLLLMGKLLQYYFPPAVPPACWSNWLQKL